MLNVAVEAPIPIPRVAIATRLKVGRFAAVRSARVSSRPPSRMRLNHVGTGLCCAILFPLSSAGDTGDLATEPRDLELLRVSTPLAARAPAPQRFAAFSIIIAPVREASPREPASIFT